MEKDYEFAKMRAASLPKFKLGQEVMTPVGRGIIVDMAFPHNGLYVVPELARASVWFGTEAALSRNGIVNCVYQLNQLKKIKKNDESICDLPSETS